MRHAVHITNSLDFLKKLIPQAGDIALTYFKSDKLETKEKGKNDIVTAADLKIDSFLTRELKKQFPHIPILTEETATGDLKRYVNEELLWIVDPIDGTFNFSRGDSNFAISIGLVSLGESIAGVCYKPVTKELYWADQDSKKSYRNNSQLIVPKIKSDRFIMGMNIFYKTEENPQVKKLIEKLLPKMLFIKVLGSSICDCLSLVEGKIDAYIDILYKPWDMAAVSCIMKNAGISISNLEGEPLDLFQASICASSREIHDTVIQAIR